MIRLIGAFLIIAASSGAGAYLNMRLFRRQRSIAEIIAALEYLKTHICVSDFEMEKALRLSGRNGAEKIFTAAADKMRSDGINAAWNAAVYENADKMFLTDTDAAALASLGDRLGLTDSEDQKGNIDSVLTALRLCERDARASYEKNGRLCRSCGILCGVLAALLLI